MDPTTLERNYSGDAPTDDAAWLVEAEIRELAKELAFVVNERLPHSREQSLALTKVEEALFWAQAAIARVGASHE